MHRLKWTALLTAVCMLAACASLRPGSAVPDSTSPAASTLITMSSAPVEPSTPTASSTDAAQTASPSPIDTATETATPIVPEGFDGLIAAGLGARWAGSQAIVVRAEGGGSQDASMWLYERSGGQWKIAAGPWPALVGRNGVSKRAEGDGKGPSGAFLLGTAFGWAKKPGGVLYQYRRLDGKDRWVDAASSPFYNRWVRGPAGACGSGETLIDIQQYKYAVAVHYNDGAEKGAGSAIFIHVWKGPETGTSGCTAVSEKNMVALLTWLDYSKRPVLLQGAEGELSLLMGEDWGMPSLPPGWGFADDFIPDAQIEAAPPAPMRMEAIEALAAVATEFRPRNIGLRMYSSEGTNGTIGLTLLGWKDGKDLDMSRPANRALLADAMRAHGFTPSDAGGQIFTFPAGGASGDFPSLAREHVIR